MNRENFFQFHREFIEQMHKIAEAKNADYSGRGDCPFDNFTSIESLGLKTEHGFLTRMMDKMSRMSTYVQRGDLKVADESFEDTCMDLANYAILFAAYMRHKAEQKALATGASTLSALTPLSELPEGY